MLRNELLKNINSRDYELYFEIRKHENLYSAGLFIEIFINKLNY